MEVSESNNGFASFVLNILGWWAIFTFVYSLFTLNAVMAMMCILQLVVLWKIDDLGELTDAAKESARLRERGKRLKERREKDRNG